MTLGGTHASGAKRNEQKSREVRLSVSRAGESLSTTRLADSLARLRRRSLGELRQGGRMGANPLEEYLRELREIRSSGAVPETSYYPALANLLNAVGGTVKPKVRCIQHPSHGAGFPDFGLFTPDQLQKSSATEPPLGTKPSRGVVEAKSTADEVVATAEGP